MESNNYNNIINNIINELGAQSPLVKKEFYIGNPPIAATLIYINGIADKKIIDTDILKPLMLHAKEDFNKVNNLHDYLVKRYITVSESYVENDFNTALYHLKRGKAALIVGEECKFIIFDTTGGEVRDISDPLNESAVRGSREGFVERLETNVSLMRRRIKEKNFVVKKLTVGQRTQTDIAVLYIDDVIDKKILENIIERIGKINVDKVLSSGELEQYLEEYPFSIFPQFYGSERPDVIAAKILEGRAAILVEGTPYVITVPAMFNEFLQAPEDYYERTIVATFTRLIRYFAIFVIITVPSAYLVLMNFNSELVPVDFINPIIEARKGIALTPFMEILTMLIAIEFLREGGLRLPSRIGQTLSVVGGIIIGEAAIRAKAVSPATLLIVGFTVVATFVISNYQMALTIRLLGYPMLILTHVFGVLGIAAFWFFIIVHLCSLESFGVDYIDINKKDMKDIVIRSSLWKMNNRPQRIPTEDNVRQTDFRKIFRRKKQ